MKLGFTGSRHGMTDAQKTAFAALVRRLGVSEFDHGDCVGSDEESHEIVREVCGSDVFITVHPPLDPKQRAFVNDADEVREPLGYLERDRNIVERTERLVATPNGFAEEQRSGTWYTVRHALKLGHPVTIIYPDGSLEQR